MDFKHIKMHLLKEHKHPPPPSLPPKKVHGEIAFGISKKAISGGLVT